MDGGSAPGAPDSANNALDTLGDLVFSHDMLANDMDLTVNNSKTPAWTSAAPNGRFGTEETLTFFDSPSVTTGGDALALPSPQSQNDADRQPISHQRPPGGATPGGQYRDQSHQPQNHSEDRKRGASELDAESMDHPSLAAMQHQQRHYMQHHIKSEHEHQASSADMLRNNQQLQVFSVAQDPHQQYPQHRMRQQSSDGGNNMLPVPSAWKYHEATGPGGLPGIEGVGPGGVQPPPPPQQQQQQQQGSNMRSQAPVVGDMGGGSVQHYPHSSGQAGAPGYHGPWTGPPQNDTISNGAPMPQQNQNHHLSAQQQQQGQWTSPQFWQQLASSQNQGQMGIHPAAVDTSASTTGMWNGGGHTGEGGKGGGGKELTDKRRQERNNREQKRSKRISDQIKELKTLLEMSGVATNKGNKSSVLTCAADYISDLQRRNQILARGEGGIGHGIDGVATMGGGVAKKVSEGEGEGGDKEHMDDGDGANGVQKNHIDYQRVFYDQSVPMAITSVDGRFVDCNWRFERESGYKKEDLVRMTFFTIARSDGKTSIFHAVAEMLKDAGENESPCVVRAVLKPAGAGQPEKAPKYLSLSTVHDHSGQQSEVKYFSCALLSLGDS